MTFFVISKKEIAELDSHRSEGLVLVTQGQWTEWMQRFIDSNVGILGEIATFDIYTEVEGNQRWFQDWDGVVRAVITKTGREIDLTWNYLVDDGEEK